MNTQFSLNKLMIRDMTPDDVPLINEFFDAMGGESRAFFNRCDINRKGALKYCERLFPDRRYWIVEDEKKMLGYVYLLDWNTGVPLLGIAVRDELKGKGLGRRLMEHAINEAKSARRGGLRLTTHVANLRGQMLYESLGFRCMGQDKNPQELFYLLTFGFDI